MTEDETNVMRDNKEILCEMAGGEVVFRDGTSIVAVLPPGRTVLSTSWLNGGCRDDVAMVFNHQLTGDSCHTNELEGGSIDAYLRLTSTRLGFDPDHATGMLTNADMGNAAVATHTFRGLTVTAVVTGGIERNGGRAGDPASFYEENDEFGDLGGTINTMLFIGASLPPETMGRVVMTAAEAKASLLQELMAPSRYSTGIATGSGTDMITVVSDRTHPLRLTNAGKHAKLGELIARCVREATRDALFRQTGLGPETQQNMLARLERFGIGEEDFWQSASASASASAIASTSPPAVAVTAAPGSGSASGSGSGSPLPVAPDRECFLSALRERATDPVLVATTAALLHIADEVAWGLLPEGAGMEAARSILAGVGVASGMGQNVRLTGDGDLYQTIPEMWTYFVALSISTYDR